MPTSKETAMKLKRVFNANEAIVEAKAGRLKGKELRKTIKLAEEFGKTEVANELKLFLVESSSFAGDDAHSEVRERVAKGISALTAMGNSLVRTRQMLKTHGVIETLNRIAKYPASTKNFERLCAAKLEHLTAEAIILDFPELFDPKAVQTAQKRLAR
jgi:hypothetical protein